MKTLFIEPKSPWENCYDESCNRQLGAELLNGEIFYTPREATMHTERAPQQYNTVKPHSSLGYRPLIPAATLPPYMKSP